jgi:phosphatidylethanolamine/phosphatidyl-N-methylethanolamine N-methyltransferase
MSEEASTLMRRAYQRWAPIYDLIYDKLTEPAARAVVEAVEGCGPRILEVGVGTGLSLGYYRASSEVVGVDLSLDMLRRAASKVTKRELGHVKGVAQMDAMHLGFPDGSFDAVAAQFLITLVPDPEAALDEMARVLRPGGEIVLVNHFGQDEGALAQIEKAVAPLSARIGWSSDFKASRVTRWARSRGLEPKPLQKIFPGGFFKLLRMRKPG